MNYRAIAAIILALIVSLELYHYFYDDSQENAKTEVVITQKAPGEEYTPGDLIFSAEEFVKNRDAREERNGIEPIVTIGATILVGAIVVFALPNKNNRRR